MTKSERAAEILNRMAEGIGNALQQAGTAQARDALLAIQKHVLDLAAVISGADPTVDKEASR